MSFVNDTFTGTDGTLLENHTGETGATWTIPSGWASSSIKLDGGRACGNYGTSYANIYIASGTPASADYTVEADYVTLDASPTQAGILGRVNADGTYFVWGCWSGGKWHMYYRNGGTSTVFGNEVAHTPQVGHTYHMTLTLTGTSATLTVTDGGTTVATCTGTNSWVPAAGHAGIELTNAVGSGTGARLDNFSASDPAPGLAAGSITVGAVGTTTANLSASDATGGTAPYSYQWYRDTASDFTPGAGNILAGKTSLSLSDTGLVRGTTYYYKIVYTDSASQMATSAQATLSACTSRCVCDGNSMTLGAGQTPYPTQLAAMLGSSWAMTNKGISGQTTQAMIADATTDVDPLCEAGNAANVAVCWEGTNDIYFNASAGDAYQHLVTYCQGRRAAGFKVVIVTLTPRNDFPGTSTLPDDKHANYEARRASVNASIRANWRSFADAMADVAGDAWIGPDGKEEDTTYYDSTKVHMVAAGYGIVASYVAEAIQMALNPGGAAADGALRRASMAGGFDG